VILTILGTAAVRGYQDVVKAGARSSRCDDASFTVIPAKAGIHFAVTRKSQWIPAFAAMTVRGRVAKG